MGGTLAHAGACCPEVERIARCRRDACGEHRRGTPRAATLARTGPSPRATVTPRCYGRRTRYQKKDTIPEPRSELSVQIMSLRFYNTLTQQVETFTPLHDK